MSSSCLAKSKTGPVRHRAKASKTDLVILPNVVASLEELCPGVSEHVLLGDESELVHDGLELLDVGVVLGSLLDLDRDSLDRSDGGREVVESSGGSDDGLDHLDGRDEVVSEAVVHSSLGRGMKQVGKGRMRSVTSSDPSVWM